MQRIGVAIVHGIEIEDDHFADIPTKLLREGFAESLGRTVPTPRRRSVIKPVHWAPDTQARQKELFDLVYQEDSTSSSRSASRRRSNGSTPAAPSTVIC